MKIKKHFVLHEVAEEHHIVGPVAEEGQRLNGIITLNGTGAFLWKVLEEQERTEDGLINALISEYGVDESIARNDVKAFLEELRSFGCLE